MLLYHLTSLKGFNKILSDGKLKPSSKNKIPDQNHNDTFSPYVYFNTIPHTHNYTNLLK